MGGWRELEGGGGEGREEYLGFICSPDGPLARINGWERKNGYENVLFRIFAK